MSSELTQLAPLPYSRGRSTRYSDRLHDFSTFLDVTRMAMSTVSFLAQLDSNSLLIECFPLTYDLNGLKARINRYLETVGSF